MRFLKNNYESEKYRKTKKTIAAIHHVTSGGGSNLSCFYTAEPEKDIKTELRNDSSVDKRECKKYQ